MRSLGKVRAAPTIGESLYCAADEAPLVYNVKFAAVQMDAAASEVSTASKLHVVLLALDANSRGGRLSIRDACASVALRGHFPDSQSHDYASVFLVCPNR